MWSVCKKEISQFFSSLTGYIAIILFLLINGVFLFLLKGSSIFDFGYASLNKFFELAPWILIFLVPAVSMRSLSEEYRAGTFEILQTRPLSNWQIVLGKYLSILLILVFVIIPTLIYVFTIKSLSTAGIDSGGIMGSYFGLLMLAAVFAAISLCCSGFTANAVVAFLVSAFVCVLVYFGFSALSKLGVFQGNVDYYLQMLGIDFHYQSISRGVIDSRDMIYFASLIFLFLMITVKSLRKR